MRTLRLASRLTLGVSLFVTPQARFTEEVPVNWWLREGAAELKSAGPLAFTPDGTLLVGDSRGRAVFALAVEEPGSKVFTKAGAGNLADADEKIAARLGTTPREIEINDLAVHPISHAVYLSVQRGLGTGARPAIVRLGGEGKVDPVDLTRIRFARAELPNPPAAGMKDESGDDVSGFTLTDLVVARGNVYVAGLTNDEFASTLRRIPIPFNGTMATTGVRIFHTHHSRYETRSPITALSGYTAFNGREYLVASYAALRWPCSTSTVFPTEAGSPAGPSRSWERELMRWISCRTGGTANDTWR